ncbi:MAG: HD domain-containing protein [Bdellovibrionales bacterium]|nr:HD domain-containing protein [Bdellovibrionales bacterium]
MSDDKYIKIRLNSIHPSEPVPFDIFILINNKHIHYLRAGDSLKLQKIEHFEKKAPDNFYILSQDRIRYKSYIRDHMNNDQLSTRDKAIILRESSMSLVEELFESPDVSKALEESKHVIDDFIEFMDRNADGMGHLIGLSSHDFYTYNHSLDVGIYSLGLGQAAGYKDSDLKELGLGALFHDIGKRHIDINIICKKGPLDDLEWAEMQKHPQFGLALMEEFEVSDEVRACCFEHHESFLGNGYPQGLEGQDIHPMARIVAITDTYDALTTKRSYNDPMRPRDALSFIGEKLKGKYDQDLLNAMLSVLFKMEKATA